MKIQAAICFFLLTAFLTGCSTYDTLNPGNGSAATDQTKDEYGQPYFLPKAKIHITISPITSDKSGTPPAAASGATPAGTTPAPSVSNVINVTQPATSDPGNKTTTTDDGLDPVAYKITVDTQLVPDYTAGPYYLRYDPNWMAAEVASVGITSDGMLSTVTTTSSDRSIQVVENLADTAVNLSKFATALGETTAKQPAKPLHKVRYRRLDIDVTFDSTDPVQEQNILNLINAPPQELVDADGSKVKLISPLTLKFVDRSASTASVPKLPAKNDPKVGGLWFREPTPFELQFEQNSEEFRRLALAALASDASDAEIAQRVASAQAALNATDAKDKAAVARAKKALSNAQNDMAETLASEDQSHDAVATLQLKVATARQQVVDAEKAVLADSTDATAQNALKAARKAQSDTRDALAKIAPAPISTPAPAAGASAEAQAALQTATDQVNAVQKDIHDNGDSPTKETALKVAQAALDKAKNDVAQGGTQPPAAPSDWISTAKNKLVTSNTVSRTAVFVTLIPNRDRVFSFNVARSAFVQNKKTTLTIADGMLNGFSIDKGSEIEGFSTLPLEISKRLVEIPKDLLSIRTDNITAKQSLINAEKSQFDSQAGLNSDTAAAQDTAATAALNAQAARIQAQLNLLNQQKALQAAQQNP